MINNCLKRVLVVHLLLIAFVAPQVLGQQSAPSKPVSSQEISDAVASATIAAAQEINAANLLKEVDSLKKASKYEDAVEKLREFLPLAPELSTATIIKANQVVDSLLVKWETALLKQDAPKPTTNTTKADDAATKYTALKADLQKARQELSTAEIDLQQSREALQTFERQQQDHKTLGAYTTRTQLQQRCVSLEVKITSTKQTIDQLEQDVEAARPAPRTYNTYVPPTPAKPSFSPSKLYTQLRADFREALQDAKQRDAKRH